MKSIIIQKLLNYPKKTITLEELETIISNDMMSYDLFANHILALEDESVLEMIKTKGRNTRTPSLAYSYRIHKQQLKKDYHDELKRYRLKLHREIQLDSYFRLDPTQWQKDLPYLQSIHTYLQVNGFPDYKVPAPERSVELFGDEKWITEGNGKELLERIGLWSKLKIMPVSDPLMFAINPTTLSNLEHKHLIVENKTTYQALVEILPETDFTSLIYGSGNKIIKSIEQFERQLPLPCRNDCFYYFGDLDRSGLFIWERLNEKKPPIQPALPFYRACLTKPPIAGKTNQRLDATSIEKFVMYFTDKEQAVIQSLLNSGHYYPQEVLKTRELQHIWRHSEWN